MTIFYTSDASQIMHIRIFIAVLLLSAHLFAATPAHATESPPLSKYQAVSLLFDHFQISVNPQYTGATPYFQQYWRDIWPANFYYAKINTACELQMFTCTKEAFFDGEGPVSTTAFLKMFYTLKWTADELRQKKELYEEFVWYMPYYQAALQNNLLDASQSLETLTFSSAEEMLHRDNVLLHYQGLIPTYFAGLEMNADTVSWQKYYKLDQITNIIELYNVYLLDLAQQKKSADSATGEKITSVITELETLQKQFISLKSSIEENPIMYDPFMPAEMKETAIAQGIKEKIGESTYDFSNSPAYRRFNIKKALEKTQGMILQPGEEFNFANIVYDKGLRDFKMGWVINKGKEEMAAGGGICGAATTLFEGAYRSGLEITERKQHSVWYRSFYPWEKIGLDAAVYRPRPNMRFVNNTGNPILLYVNYTSDSVANFQIWGVKHFDTLTLEGPNYNRGRTRWIRTIWMKDGAINTDELISYFGKIH